MGIIIAKEAADVCQTSIDILKSRCEKALAEMYSCRSIWFPDDYRPYPAGIPAGEILDVVLFGGFFRRFLESGVWPNRRIRIWTLCEASRSVLASVSGIPGTRIRAIPRSLLFPEIRTRVRFPDVTRPFTLVFAGRISAQKNIEALVWTTYYLQKIHRLPVSLHLFGDFDDQYHPDRGWRKHEGYEAVIKALVERLDWTERPAFAGKLPADEWPGRAPPNPLFINLSTYICEDFGVAQAQAQAAGWGSVVSDWGGYKDLSDLAAIKIPGTLIGNSHEAPGIVRLKARNLAAILSGQLAMKSGLSFDLATEKPDTEAPEPTELETLDRHRRRVIEELGPDSHLIHRFGLDAFAGTDAGRKFFGKYRLLFSGHSEGSPVILLTHENGDVPAFYEGVVEYFSGKGRAVLLLPVRGLFSAEHVWAVSKASGVIIPMFSVHLKPLIEFLTRQLMPSAPILLFASHENQTSELDALRPLFRSVDRACAYDPAHTKLDQLFAGFSPEAGP